MTREGIAVARCGTLSSDERYLVVGGYRRFPGAPRGTGTYREPISCDEAIEEEERRPWLRIVDYRRGGKAAVDIEPRRSVKCVAWVADPAVFVTGSGYGDLGRPRLGILEVWGLPDARLVRAVEHADKAHVTGLAAVRGGAQVLAACGWDRVLRLYETDGCRLIRTFEGHRRMVHCVAAAGSTAVSGADDGEVRLWDLDSGRCRTLVGHRGPVLCVAISSAATFAVTGGSDDTVRLWKLPSGKAAASLKGHSDPVWSVALSADALLIASGGFDRVLRLWRVRTGRLVTQANVGAPIVTVAFSPGAEQVHAITQAAGQVFDLDVGASRLSRAACTARALPGAGQRKT